MTAWTMTGKLRRKPGRGAPLVDGQRVHPHEIAPGRPVPNDWDKHLFEPWAERKARLAQEREEAR